jgi:hypothetical protein
MTYQMQGTPTTILIDKTGHLRMHKFGHVTDFVLGYSIGTLLAEETDDEAKLTSSSQQEGRKNLQSNTCGPDECAV